VSAPADLGDFEALPMLRTGLALAGANRSAAGLLTGTGVLSLSLSGTALVVLSACATGVGEMEQNEGLASLGRAFNTAGAKAVVISLWEVPDVPARDVIMGFYAHLAKNLDGVLALRAAKLEARRRYPEVRNWGGFLWAGRFGSLATDAWAPPGVPDEFVDRD
jgi:CHAT domain-containing protein